MPLILQVNPQLKEMLTPRSIYPQTCSRQQFIRKRFQAWHCETDLGTGTDTIGYNA